MLQVIINLDTKARIKKRNDVLGQKTKSFILTDGDIISLDDMTTDISGLENYAFPSLFSIVTPVVHGKYLLEQFADQLTKELLSTLVDSPTFFLLEERSLPAVFLKTLEKSGAIVHIEKPIKTISNQSNIFNVTNSITSPSKKDRWLSYRKSLEEHAVEAVMGILYWKLRSLIESSSKNKNYKNIYTSFMKAHKNAWQKGFPLELAIEKVILEQ